MEQQTRNSNVLNVFNLFDPQAHGIQSTQANSSTGNSNLPARIQVSSIVILEKIFLPEL